jgi:uncharacterized membrane protein
VTTPNVPPGGTATGLPPNIAGALSYLLGPITGIVFLVLEKENRFIRFHAMQSTIVGAVWVIISMVLPFFFAIPILGWLIAMVSSLFGLIGLALCLFMMFQAFQGKEWEFPVLGAYARQQMGGAA